jgi:hypothetical protein
MKVEEEVHQCGHAGNSSLGLPAAMKRAALLHYLLLWIFCFTDNEAS